MSDMLKRRSNHAKMTDIWSFFSGNICIIRKKTLPLCPVWKMLLEK